MVSSHYRDCRAVCRLPDPGASVPLWMISDFQWYLFVSRVALATWDLPSLGVFVPLRTVELLQTLKPFCLQPMVAPGAQQ